MYSTNSCPTSLSRYRANGTLGTVEEAEQVPWDAAFDALWEELKDLTPAGTVIDMIIPDSIQDIFRIIFREILEAEIKKSLNVEELTTAHLAELLTKMLIKEIVEADVVDSPIGTVYDEEGKEDILAGAVEEGIWNNFFGNTQIDPAGNITKGDLTKGIVFQAILWGMNKVVEEITGVEATIPPEQDDPNVQTWLKQTQDYAVQVIKDFGPIENWNPGRSFAFNKIWPVVYRYMMDTKPVGLDPQTEKEQIEIARQAVVAAIDLKSRTGVPIVAVNMSAALMPKKMMKQSFLMLPNIKGKYSEDAKPGIPIVPIAIGGVALIFLLKK